MVRTFSDRQCVACYIYEQSSGIGTRPLRGGDKKSD